MRRSPNAKTATAYTRVTHQQFALISTVYASEQSEAKGFVEDAEGSVLFRTGYLHRDKKNGVDDTSSLAQTAIVKLDSGFTKGVVGFGVGAVGDASFKIGENNHAGNGMIPLHNKGEKDAKPSLFVTSQGWQQYSNTPPEQCTQSSLPC